MRSNHYPTVNKSILAVWSNHYPRSKLNLAVRSNHKPTAKYILAVRSNHYSPAYVDFSFEVKPSV